MTDRQSTHNHDCWGWGPKHYECAVREIERLAARLTAAQQQPAEDGCHCGTCTCNPNMTPAVRFDLSPAQQEGAIREHLIRLGWTPPDEHALSQQPAAPSGEVVAGVEPLLESLIQAAFDDGDNEREEFSERVKAARASVVAYVQRLGASPQQPAAVDGPDAQSAEIEALRAEVERLNAELVRLEKIAGYGGLASDAPERMILASEVYDGMQSCDKWCEVRRVIDDGQPMPESATPYVRADRAERLAEALKEIRSRSAMNFAMRSDQFELTARLGDIYQIADAALAQETKV